MLPNLTLLEKIQSRILEISNRQGEFKRPVHYGLFLLCYEAGLRVSEAINFNPLKKTHKGLYRLNKTKGKKQRFVYIPKSVISELKKNDWKPNSTNRFNFYHFLKKIKQEINLPTNIELTPRTLRRSFTTYHAENGLPLPLLSKLLGHKSIKTTALYWMNIYNDNGNDADDILAGKVWLEKPKKPPLEPEAPVNLNSDKMPRLLAPNSLVSKPHLDCLSKIQQLEHKLSQIQSKKDEETTRLKNELSQANKQNKTLQTDLAELSEQNTTLCQEKSQAIAEKEQNQQDLTTKDKIISQLTQELANEQEQRKTAENNLLKEKQNNHVLRETNTNLTQKLSNQEQNHTNLINTYQKTLKDKQIAEKQLNQLTKEIKNAARLLLQWQKFNYYQQLEKSQLKAQIIQLPPWKPNK